MMALRDCEAAARIVVYGPQDKYLYEYVYYEWPSLAAVTRRAKELAQQHFRRHNQYRRVVLFDVQRGIELYCAEILPRPEKNAGVTAG